MSDEVNETKNDGNEPVSASSNSSEDDPIGDTHWSLPGGYVPTESTGPEPEMVSHDELCVLNAGEEMATLEITLTYENGREAGPYLLQVAPRRVRHVRINDLIDPYAPPLGTPYGIVLESNVPVVVQCSRQDTRQVENATLTAIAYGEDSTQRRM